jgi:hypothetical protein
VVLESSLEVRINGVLWEEGRNLIALGPKTEGYPLEISDEGKPSLVFGDGEHGARLPSGVENVVAKYRVGIGTSGNGWCWAS